MTVAMITAAKVFRPHQAIACNWCSARALSFIVSALEDLCSIKPSMPLESKLYWMLLRIFTLLMVGAPPLKNQNSLRCSEVLCVNCLFTICNTKAFASLNCADLKFQPPVAGGNGYRAPDCLGGTAFTSAGWCTAKNSFSIAYLSENDLQVLRNSKRWESWKRRRWTADQQPAFLPDIVSFDFSVHEVTESALVAVKAGSSEMWKVWNMFAASLLALTLFACCFASLTNNAPSRTLELPKKEFSLKYWILLTQALFMFCRQSRVARFVTRMKNLVTAFCVCDLSLLHFLPFVNPWSCCFLAPSFSFRRNRITSSPVQGERKRQGLNSLDHLECAQGNIPSDRKRKERKIGLCAGSCFSTVSREVAVHNLGSNYVWTFLTG